MINDLSRRYLQELRAAQQQIDSSNLKDEIHDDADHEVIETHTSEYNIELGPLKVNVKKSRTVSGKATSSKKQTQSIAKNNLISYEESLNKARLEQMRQLKSPDQFSSEDYKRIDFKI